MSHLCALKINLLTGTRGVRMEMKLGAFLSDAPKKCG